TWTAEGADETLRQRDRLAGLGLPCAFAEVRQDVADALHVRDRLLELVHGCGRCVNVRVDQSRHHRLAAEVDPLCARTSEFRDLSCRAGLENASVANGHGFDDVELWIDRGDLCAVRVW